MNIKFVHIYNGFHLAQRYMLGYKGFSRAKLEEKYEFASFCGHYSSSTFSNTRSFGKFGNIHDCFTGKCTSCKIHTKLNRDPSIAYFQILLVS